MVKSVFDDMKAYIGFDAADEANLRSLDDCVGPYVPTIVDRFYEQILSHPEARQVFANGREDWARAKGLLAQWLTELFCGTYDQSYYEKRSSIGSVHVRVGLPQRYMITAMEIVWQELRRAIREVKVPDLSDKMFSLHKLLTLELGIMLEGYKESYSAQVQQRARNAFQEKLTRAEHLAQIGQLAAEAGHDFFTLPPGGVDFQKLEEQLLRQALARTGNNQTKASKLLNLSRDTFRYRLEKHGLL